MHPNSKVLRVFISKCRLTNVRILFFITIAFTLALILHTALHRCLKRNLKLRKEVDTVKNNDADNILDFPRQWCRIEKWRHDWEGMLGECSESMAWEKRNTTSPDRTNAEKSYISRWELSPSGHFSRFWIQTVNVNGDLKNHGGDAWRVYIHQGPASLAPVVFDHQDGGYEVLFLTTEPGVYKAQIFLDYTLCDGFRDPPKDWFTIGTTQGKYQKDGALGYIGDDYIPRPLGGRKGTKVIIRIDTNDDSQGFFEYCSNYSEGVCTSYKKPILLCQDEVIPKCFSLWNGHGQWIKNQWKPFFTGLYDKRDSSSLTPVRRSGTLWLFGDSRNLQFTGLVGGRPLCTKIFKACKSSYNWIYQLTNVHEGKTKYDGKDFNASIILNQIRDILNRSDMNHEDSAFVFNMGVHFPISLNFTTFKALVQDVIQLFFVSGKISNESGSGDMTPDKQHGGNPKSKAESYSREGLKKRRFKAYLIWRTAAAIQKENCVKDGGALNFTFARFETYQRLHLFQSYANSAMCKAGLPLLDVYPLTSAYPKGTQDTVHFNNEAFVPVAETLEKFFRAKKNTNKSFNL